MPTLTVASPSVLVPNPPASVSAVAIASVLDRDCASRVRAAETIALADQESFPIRTVSGAAPFEPIVRVSGPGLAVEAVKLAEDGSGDVIVRVREVLGARSRGAVELCTPVAEAIECDLVERQHLAVDPGNLEFRQFEVKTLRFR